MNIKANTTVAVYQTWEMDRFVADDLRRAARSEDVATLRKLVRKGRSSKSYCGSFELASDMGLEDIYLLLQNDSHRDGWVKALRAQDSWLETTGGAPSLSMGDFLVIRDEIYVVAMVGFVKL